MTLPKKIVRDGDISPENGFLRTGVAVGVFVREKILKVGLGKGQRGGLGQNKGVPAFGKEPHPTVKPSKKK